MAQNLGTPLDKSQLLRFTALGDTEEARTNAVETLVAVIPTGQMLAQMSAEDLHNLIGIPLPGAQAVTTWAKITYPVAPISTVPSQPTPAPTPVPPAQEEISEGKTPTPLQMNSFANQVGMDSNMLSMFMMAQMGGNMGIDLDMSSFIPIAQVVASYNPKKKDMAYMVMAQIERRLGTPIVVINSNGSVNPTMTQEYVTELENGFPPAEDDIYYGSDSVAYQVIRVGMDAQSVYNADPLNVSVALRSNGMGIGRIRYNEVGLDVRQVLYLAVSQTGELSADNEAKLSWLREHIKPGVTRADLTAEFPKAVTAWNVADRAGSLPALRVQVSNTPRRQNTLPNRRAVKPRDMNTYNIQEEGRPGQGDSTFRDTF